MDKKSRSIVPMEAEKVDHVAADVEAAEDSVAVASAVEVAVDSAEAVEAVSVVTVVVDSAVTVVVDSAVAVEADSVVAVEVAAAAEVVGVTTAIKMDILLANVLRAAKTTLVVEIATKKPNYQDEVNAYDFWSSSSPFLSLMCLARKLKKNALLISRRRRHRCHYVSFASKEVIV